MVKHIIVWKLKDEYSEGKAKEETLLAIKNGLEGLAGKIPGLLEIQVRIVPCSGNSDLMLDSTFDTIESLKAYGTNPAHVAIADGIVRPRVAIRSCFDYEF